jgi:hypothetical protein
MSRFPVKQISGIGATGADSIAAADQAAGRSAIGLGRVIPIPGGVAVATASSGFNVHSSPYTFSVQTNLPDTSMEILNSYGAGGGAFFGIYGNDFNLYSYQGGDCKVLTGPTAGSSVNQFVFKKDGHTQLPGGIALKYYTSGTKPAAGAVNYGTIITMYDGFATPNTWLEYTDGSVWSRLEPLRNSQTLTLAAAVKFDRMLTYYSPADAGSGLVFTANSIGAIVGATAILELTANGGAAPNFTAFKKLSGSEPWVNTSGTVNLVQITYFSATSIWYSISQQG